MKRRHFQVAVIGSGPGGYVAAIRAAQQGASVALIEEQTLGGTCLNRGCIPTKSLTASAHLWKEISRASSYGIEVKGAAVNFIKMLERKEEIVTAIRSNLKQLLTSNKIHLIFGRGKLNGRPEGKDELKIFDSSGEAQEIITADKVILATGSEPLSIPAFPFDGKYIHSSTSILHLEKQPASIAIIGGGYIGCEFASIFQAIGTKVLLIEASDRLINHGCSATSGALLDAFRDQGCAIHLETMVKAITPQREGVSVEIISKGDKKKLLEAEISLVAVGRALNTEDLGLEKVGLSTRLDAKAGGMRGSIEVDASMQTAAKGIYAIGDITGQWLLAHSASHQGVIAADHALGKKNHLRLDTIPSVIFTSPEIASVGLHLEEALAKGLKAYAQNFPFAALGKSHAGGHTEGFGQIVVEEGTERILGAQVVGYEAGALIGEMALAITQELTLDSIHETVHAHPTISEVWLETAFMAKGQPLHLPPKS